MVMFIDLNCPLIGRCFLMAQNQSIFSRKFQCNGNNIRYFIANQSSKSLTQLETHCWMSLGRIQALPRCQRVSNGEQGPHWLGRICRIKPQVMKQVTTSPRKKPFLRFWVKIEIASDQNNISMCSHNTLRGGTGCQVWVYRLFLLIFTHGCMDSVVQ